jgi:hypothetical protein
MRRIAAAAGQTARHECRKVCGEAGVDGRLKPAGSAVTPTVLLIPGLLSSGIAWVSIPSRSVVAEENFRLPVGCLLLLVARFCLPNELL